MRRGEGVGGLESPPRASLADVLPPDSKLSAAHPHVELLTRPCSSPRHLGGCSHLHFLSHSPSGGPSLLLSSLPFPGHDAK